MSGFCVLAKYGEIAVKGRNQGWFENCLVRNLRHAVGGPVLIRRRGGFLVASAHHRDPAELTRRLQEVMGLNVVQPALSVPPTVEDATAAAVDLLRRRHAERPGAPVPTFAVRARRRWKDFPMSSDAFAAHIGARVCAELGWRVDLAAPEVPVLVEVDRREIFVSVERLPGQGGLPVGCSGRALVLLSGGYDSPVAAYRAMRRGLHCDFVHFTGAPYTDPSSMYKAYALARELGRYQTPARLYVVPVGNAQKTLATAGAEELQIVARRRLYLRIAEELARRRQRDALVTGDSLGQVASQTLSNLVSADQACTLPVLRPLIGWDKQEIITEARRIGTAEISVLRDEDCCSLLAPSEVATRTNPADLRVIEQRADIDTLVEQALEHVTVLTPGRVRGAEPPRAKVARPTVVAG
ncbi:tRNA uracil 4-sulfurtransferase ThiI [Nocardia farcinica]|uniref:Probable tRNA sulfurtransferase n=1 Tax=Nocardia farcinica (strain IFM 10152) TaxID=247156 RepID=THII_NOCFA|nr:tRNA uracil 4-sulfurtransferase ThiI [Nocardia farcinica]Q5YY71.1 RecName: Full=Probable tRNA sulfurtransferase; AltName: Full=Sulfur carrier protein ThiS sulfurtransferase; AltName: Full=Thiamine biosynthesis protein ThiI; AltName: Full=tRNA 4-thiouridine synthase [Nocardia farcinica IFM 10152]BAD56870.1 putative thiamin biosynthesis protein [Nocardia farcinica IFM 10152]